MSRRVLTGIKPTGSPHVGNHLGAIRPALRLADEGLEAMYFIADYHAEDEQELPEHHLAVRVIPAAKECVSRSVSDSTPPHLPNDPDPSTIFQIRRTVATPGEARALAERFRTGISWGEAKDASFERLEAELSAARGRYLAIVADPTRIDALLSAGATRARASGRPVLDRVRRAIGIAR